MQQHVFGSRLPNSGWLDVCLASSGQEMDSGNIGFATREEYLQQGGSDRWHAPRPIEVAGQSARVPTEVPGDLGKRHTKALRLARRRSARVAGGGVGS